MRTGKLKNRLLTASVIFCLMILSLSVSSPSADCGIFLTSGLFRFNNSQFRQIYGLLPVFGFSLELFPLKYLGLSTGFTYLSRKGEAMTLAGEPEPYPVRFSRLTFPLLLKYCWSKNRFEVTAGLGLAYSSYKETWQELALSYRGHSWHFRCELGADYHLFSRLWLRTSLTAESIPTGARSPLLRVSKANLAGFSFQVGIGYKL